MGQCGPHSSRRPHRGGGNRGPHAGTPSCYPDKRGSPSIFPQPAKGRVGECGVIRVLKYGMGYWGWAALECGWGVEDL